MINPITYHCCAAGTLFILDSTIRACLFSREQGLLDPLRHLSSRLLLFRVRCRPFLRARKVGLKPKPLSEVRQARQL